MAILYMKTARTPDRALWMALLSGALGLGGGWAFARLITPMQQPPVELRLPSAGPQAVAGASPAAVPAAGIPLPAPQMPVPAPLTTTPAAGEASLDGLLRRALAGRPEDVVPTTAALAQLGRRAQHDPVLRDQLMRRFQTEKDEATQRALATALARLAPRDVANFVQQLAHGDVTQRASAFRLLAMAPDAAVKDHAVLQQALYTEQDVSVLREAVSALGPRPVMDPSQSRATLARLGELAESQDPQLRADSLRVLAQWDKTGAVAEPRLVQALSSRDPELRADAVYAVASSNMASGRMKAGLIAVAGDPSANADTRSAALSALERYALNAEEYAFYLRVNQSLTQAQAQPPATYTGPSALAAPGAADTGGAVFTPFGR